MIDAAFLAPRRCLLEPIPQIFAAAELLDRAADAHIAGDRCGAGELLEQADMPAIFEWTEAVWGPTDPSTHRVRDVPGQPLRAPKGTRVRTRMPSAAEQRALIARDGHVCGFCGMPVAATAARDAMRRSYPDVVRWGPRNRDRHTALLCMALTFDHVVPHSRGGGHGLDNMVVTCAPCNAGRSDYTLAELGLVDPRTRPLERTSWDGLIRFLQPG